MTSNSKLVKKKHKTQKTYKMVEHADLNKPALKE